MQNHKHISNKECEVVILGVGTCYKKLKAKRMNIRRKTTLENLLPWPSPRGVPKGNKHQRYRQKDNNKSSASIMGNGKMNEQSASNAEVHMGFIMLT